jgi:REase_DpnII-MboI
VNEVNKDTLREYLRWTDVLRRSMEVASRGADPANVWRHGGYKQFARKYNQIVEEIASKMSLPPIPNRYDIAEIPGGGDTLAFQQREIFQGVHANVPRLRGFLENKIGVIEDETVAIRDFFQAKLRSAIFRAPKSEREVHDAVEQRLIGRRLRKGQEYDREIGGVKVSSKEAVPDFILHRLSLAIEPKLIESTGRLREVVDEINADVAAYSKWYRSLLFIVYELGYICDEIEFRHDLKVAGNVAVVVVKQ